MIAYQLLDRITYPIRKPYVRDLSFVDGKGPPPYGYFDETQDHLGAYFHALLGWKFSADMDEFTSPVPFTVPTGDLYFGRLLVQVDTGTTTKQSGPPVGMGEHGVWKLFSGAGPFRFAASSALISLDGDFLMTAKVTVNSRENLNTADSNGFVVSTGSTGIASPVPPGFACGKDLENWQIRYADDDGGPLKFADTGIRVINQSWYRLQVSRVQGAVRWFINGALVRINGIEGVYYPVRMLLGQKWIECSRMLPGAGGVGFTIDSFHLLAERSNA